MKLKKQLKLSRFLFNYPSEQCFGTSQWPCIPIEAFILYKLTMMIYFLAWLIVSLLPSTFDFYLDKDERGKFFIYLTNLAFVLLNMHLVVAAGVSIMLYFKAEREDQDLSNNSEKLAWYLQLDWILYNLTACISILVTLTYWTLLYNGKGTNAVDLNLHAIQSVYVIFDVMFSAMPIRLQHFWLTSLASIIYGSFTIIYWAAGGTGAKNSPYIYPVLDYDEKPGMAVGLIVLFIFVLAPFGQMILTILVCFRNWCHKKCFRVSYDLRMDEIDISVRSDDKHDVANSKEVMTIMEISNPGFEM